MLLDGLRDPLGVGIAANRLVEGIDQNHLKMLFYFYLKKKKKTNDRAEKKRDG